MNIKRFILSVLLFGSVSSNISLSAEPVIVLREDEKLMAPLTYITAGVVVGSIAWIVVAKKLNKLQVDLEKLEKIEELEEQDNFELDDEMLLILDYLKEHHSDFFEKYFGGEGKGDFRFISGLGSGVLAGVIAGLLTNKLIFN